MRVLTAQVVEGRIEVPTEFSDGTAVAVLAIDGPEHELTEVEADELSSALAQIRSGRFVDGRSLLADLRARHRT